MARDERRVEKRLGELKASVRALDLGRKFLGLWDRRSPEEARIGDTVGSVMTRNVVTCTGSDTLHRAAQLMWDRDCGAIPVVDAHGRAVGLVTDRDLCMAAYTRGRPLSAISVSSLLSARLYTCTVTTSLDEAIARMAAHRVRRLVVVDAKDQKLVGMLALADLAVYSRSLARTSPAAPLLIAELLASLSERVPGPTQAAPGSSDPRAAE
ncbi:MAG TPA: CBS domain-containing protein [Polyangiaceae bacterium]|nr:CBS domain-containing protein [Polyangiaceae bacterium]